MEKSETVKKNKFDEDEGSHADQIEFLQSKLDAKDKLVDAARKLVETHKNNNLNLAAQLKNLNIEREWIEPLHSIDKSLLAQSISQAPISKEAYNSMRDWIKPQIFNLMDNRLSEFQIMQLESKLGISALSISEDLQNKLKIYKDVILKSKTVNDVYDHFSKIDNTLNLSENHLNTYIDLTDYINIKSSLTLDKLKTYVSDPNTIIDMMIITFDQDEAFKKANNIPNVFEPVFQTIKNGIQLKNKPKKTKRTKKVVEISESESDEE